MSILRSTNWLGGMRVDVPHLRALESSIAGDFDLVCGHLMAGDQALVINGFDINTVQAIGSSALTLQLNVAGGMILHSLATEAGTIFKVDLGTAPEILSTLLNPVVIGNFTPSQTNYVGLDLRRTADPTTADTVVFIDSNTKEEINEIVPLARTLNYRIVISTSDFTTTPNILPIAIVVTDAQNTVVSLADARQMAFRLGQGGSSPDNQHSYPWPELRDEKVKNTAGLVFSGGDKTCTSLKAFSDALMTRLWEIGGGEFWYSPTRATDVKLVFGQPVLISNGDNFAWDWFTYTLTWSGIAVSFANSTATFNAISGGALVVGEGQCLYVDLDRATDGATLTPAVADLATVGLGDPPGCRTVIAWCRNNAIYIKDHPYEVGRAYKVASELTGTSGLGVVRLAYAPGSITAPTVIPLDATGQITNAASSGNSYAFKGTGYGTGPGGWFIGGLTDGIGVYGQGKGTGVGGLFEGGLTNAAGIQADGGGGTGMGALLYGANNTASNTVFDRTARTPGPSNGATIYGGAGLYGGDGLQVFARGDGSRPRNAIVAFGSDPITANCSGGRGLWAYGGNVVGPTSGDGGIGVYAVGGSVSGGSGTPGYGLFAAGGSNSTSTGNGGGGLITGGGDSVGGTGGRGLFVAGGNSSTGTGGIGATIGGGGSTSGSGGTGLVVSGGVSAGTNPGGIGLRVGGGTNISGDISPAVELVTGEITYPTPPTRTFTVAGTDFVPDATGAPLWVSNENHWITGTTGNPFVLGFNLRLPLGSIVTGIKLFVMNTDTGNNHNVNVHLVRRSTFYTPPSGPTIESDGDLFDGTASHGLVTSVADSAWHWLDCGTPLGTGALSEGYWFWGYIEVPAAILTSMKISALRVTYTQAQCSHTV